MTRHPTPPIPDIESGQYTITTKLWHIQQNIAKPRYREMSDISRNE